MEDTLNDHPSLPANYVSLANLQQRWLKQQQQQKERQESQQQQLPKPHKGNQKTRNKLQMKAKITEPQKPSIGIEDEGVAKFVKRNPNFKLERSIRRNFNGRNGPKVSNATPQASKNEGNFPTGVKIDNGDHSSSDKKLQLVPSKIESNVAEKVEIIGGDQFGTEKKIMDEKVKKWKKKMKKKSKQNGAVNGENVKEREEKVEIIGGDQFGAEKKIMDEKVKKGKKSKKKKSTQDGAVNGENVKERENRGKEGNGDQTMGIRRRFEKIFVDRREWRSDGRCTAWIDGRRGVNRSYERVKHRGMERKRLEKGMVWVKKGEVSEQSEVS